MPPDQVAAALLPRPGLNLRRSRVATRMGELTSVCVMASPRTKACSLPEATERTCGPVCMAAAYDGLEHWLPAVGAVDIAGTQRAAFQITELVEYEQRVIAGPGVMAVPDAHLLLVLLAVGRAYARIHVEHDAARRDCAPGLSTGGTGRSARTGWSLLQAAVSRSGPSGLVRPRGREQPCRRRSSASQDRDEDVRHRSHPRSRGAPTSKPRIYWGSSSTMPTRAIRSCPLG